MVSHIYHNERLMILIVVVKTSCNKTNTETKTSSLETKTNNKTSK